MMAFTGSIALIGAKLGKGVKAAQDFMPHVVKDLNPMTHIGEMKTVIKEFAEQGGHSSNGLDDVLQVASSHGNNAKQNPLIKLTEEAEDRVHNLAHGAAGITEDTIRLFERLGEGGQEILKNGTKFGSTVGDSVAHFAQTAGKDAVTNFKYLGDNAGTTLKHLADNTGTALHGMGDSVAQFAQTAGHGLDNALNATGHAILPALINVTDHAIPVLQKVVAGVEHLGPIASAAVQTAPNLIQAHGIGSALYDAGMSGGGILKAFTIGH